MSENEENWSIATSEDGGKPLIYRIRNAPPSFARKASFPNMIAISWQFNPLNESGMPPPEVTERMSDFEDRLTASLESAHTAFLSVVVTGNSVREFQWYARDSQKMMRLVNESLAGCAVFPVAFSIAEDPQWGAYSQFTDLLG